MLLVIYQEFGGHDFKGRRTPCIAVSEELVCCNDDDDTYDA